MAQQVKDFHKCGFLIAAQGNGSHGCISMGSGHSNSANGSSRGNGGGGNGTINGRSGTSSIPSSSVGAPSNIVSTSTGIIGGTCSTSEPMNDIEKYLNIRKQVEQRRKNLFPVQPKPPQGFKDYLMNRKTYLLQVLLLKVASLQLVISNIKYVVFGIKTTEIICI